ncbi:MAG: 30S ribosomal protein S1 [Planctomycetes bacterium]|nr:30S ribosomal protein S1 [Planctomycetota bacterium]
MPPQAVAGNKVERAALARGDFRRGQSSDPRSRAGIALAVLVEVAAGRCKITALFAGSRLRAGACALRGGRQARGESSPRRGARAGPSPNVERLVPVVRKTHPAVKENDLPAAELDRLVEESLGDFQGQSLDEYLAPKQNYALEQIVRGRIISISNDSDEVLVDIGYKSEGVVPRMELEDGNAYKAGDEIDVSLESLDDHGTLVLSKRKADRKRAWDRVINTYKEGDTVSGKVMRQIKGGLLLDIGVPAFLPASQVSLRRAGNIKDLEGQDLPCTIIKIDPSRMNIVVSRRKLLEDQRARLKEGLLADLEEGQVRDGVVKNIVDFGAFVDLGGIDGLLHITDMSWGRVTHPSEVVAIDQKIKVKVLKVDREKERIALGMKQLLENPWERVLEKYPIGSRHNGKVVNVMSYGAFVKLEDGIEGLVHISEMSWTRRVAHPSEIVQANQDVAVVVLDVNRDKQEISLGMKQAEANPWEAVESKFPVGTHIKGKVRNLTNYGAFIELEEGIDGLLHVSDMSWTRKVSNPAEVLKKGQDVEAVVISVDTERKRVALGVKQLTADPWQDTIPQKYAVGARITGLVTKITNFGVFVELEKDLEGLLHVSELADRRGKGADKTVADGQKLAVEVIKLDAEEHRIGLKLSDDEFDAAAADAPALAAPAADAPALAAPAGDAPAPAAPREPAVPASAPTPEAGEAPASPPG